MKYLKVFVDFADRIKILGDAECGRLFRAMMKYASSGAEPKLSGNEKFLWGMVKSEIDRQAESYENICSTNKRIATERYEALRSVTVRNEAYQDKDKEQDKDKDKEKEIKKTTPNGVAKESSRFLPPTLEEVTAYCRERNNGVNPEKFINYYSSNGWMVGRNKMKDWKAAVRNWEAKDGRKATPEKGQTARGNPDDLERLERILNGIKGE